MVGSAVAAVVARHFLNYGTFLASLGCRERQIRCPVEPVIAGILRIFFGLDKLSTTIRNLHCHEFYCATTRSLVVHKY
jgi:hypothetical protein